jgi:hypothetical protein
VKVGLWDQVVVLILEHMIHINVMAGLVPAISIFASHRSGPAADGGCPDQVRA